jgi:hypothetical protein
MAKSYVAPQFHHVVLLKDISHQTIIFSEMKATALSGHDTSCILATMLKNGQSIEQELIHLQEIK